MKEYWSLNKKSYYIFGIMLILMTIFYLFFVPYFDSITVSQIESELNNADYFQENLSTAFGLVIFAFTLGAFSIIVTLYKFYLILRPFVKKQLQQTALMGKSPYKFILTHLVLIIIVCLIDTASSFVGFSSTYELYQSFTFIDAIKKVCSTVAFPLWVMTMPLLIVNGKVLTDLSARNRMLMIIGGCLLLWAGVSLVNFVPSISSLISFSINGEYTMMASDVVTSSRQLIFNLLVDFVGIFVFILAINSYKKNWETTL